MGFMLAPIQSRVTIPLFCPASPFGGRSSSFSLSLPRSRPFSSLVLRIPFNSLSTPPSHPFPPYRTVVYISRGSFAHHRLAAVLASRESEFLPAAPPFLAFSLRLYLPLSFHLWPPSVLSGFLRRLSYPPIYTCIPVHFVSTRSVAHASSLLLLLLLFLLFFLPLPSAPSGSARARSRGPFPSRLSISSSQAAGTLVLLVLFAPFRFTTGAGRLCPPSPRSSPARPHRGCSPFCIAQRYPPYLLFLTYPCSRRDSVGLHRRSLAARSPTVSSSVRCTFLSISPAGGTGGEGSSLLQVVPASDRRRCRVSRNRSPPMPRGGRTVAPVHLLSLLRLLLFSARSILFVFFFSSRGIVNTLIRGD